MMFGAAVLHSQSTPPPASEPKLTVESIFGDNASLPWPPSEFFWSPDSATVAYIATAPDVAIHSTTGDLIAIDTATARPRILAHSADLDPIATANSHLTPIELDHRNRYSEASIFFAPDSHSLLFDAAGNLYLFDPARQRTHHITSAAVTADDPKFSPNGKFVSYIRDHSLFIHSVTGRDERRIAAGTSALLSGEVDWLYLEELSTRSNYFWSPDATRIAYLQTDESLVPLYNIPDANITMHYPSPGTPNPAVRVAVANIASPSHTTFINIPLSKNNDYIPRFGWVNAGTLWIEVLDRNQQQLRLYFADAATGNAAVVYTESDHVFLNDNYDFTFLHAQPQFLRASWQSGHEHLYLYSFNAAVPLSQPATLTRQITAGDFDVESITAISPDDSVVYFVSNEMDPIGRNLWRYPINLAAENNPSPARIASGYTSYTWDGTHDVSLSPNTTSFVDTYSTIAATPRVFFSAKNFQPAPEFPIRSTSWQSPSPPIHLTLIAADGHTQLYGWLTLPAAPHARNASIPLVLNPYGGPGVQQVRDQWQFQDTAFTQLLAQHGIATLELDNRGMAMRGRDFAQAAHDDLSATQLADQLTALDQVIAHYPQLDGNRLGIYGWSFGGNMALYAMTHSTRFRTGVSVAAVTDWRSYDSAFTERYLGLPAANSSAYEDDNLITSALRLHGHLLLAYGTGDDNVHAINSTNFAAALKSANISFDSMSFPGQTHSLDSSTSRVQLYTRILEQFQSDLNSVPLSP